MFPRLNNHHKNLLFYAVPSVVSRFSSFLLIPLLTRVLSPEEFGVASVALVVAGFVELVVLPGLEGIYLRYGFTSADGISRPSKNFPLLVVVQLLLVGLAFPIVGSLGIWLSSKYAPNIPPLFLVIAISATALTSLHAPYLSYLRYVQKIQQFAWFQGIEALLRLFVIVLGLLVFRWGSLSLLLGELIPAFFLFPVSLQIFFKIDYKTLRSTDFQNILRALLTAGPDAIVSWAFTAVDRFVLNHFRGAKTTGLYSAVYPVASLIYSVEIILQRQAKVFVYRICESKGVSREVIHELYIENLRVTLTLCALCALASPLVLPLLLGPEYLAGIAWVPFLCVIPLLRTIESFFKVLCWGDQRRRVLTVSNLMALFIFVAANLMLVPRYGAKGAIAAGILALMVYPVLILFYKTYFKELILQWNELDSTFILSALAFGLAFFDFEKPPLIFFLGMVSLILLRTSLKYFQFLSNLPEKI